MSAALGLLRLGRVEPGRKPENAPPVPPGLWCLHTSSLVPYVRFEGGEFGRELTWGEAIELRENTSIVNASKHAGDVVLAPAVGGIAAPRPRLLALPVELSNSPSGAGVLRSQRLDVRNVVRVYLVKPAAAFLAATLFDVEQVAERETAGAPGAIDGSRVLYSINLLAAAGQVNLSPQALQPPVLDFRPGIFWDWLRIETTAVGWTTDNSYFTLNYD